MILHEPQYTRTEVAPRPEIRRSGDEIRDVFVGRSSLIGRWESVMLAEARKENLEVGEAKAGSVLLVRGRSVWQEKRADRRIKRGICK